MTPVKTGRSTDTGQGRPWARLPWCAPVLIFLLALTLLVGGCNGGGESVELVKKARAMMEAGNHEDAARNFATVAELAPNSPLGESSLFWAANLYHHFLNDTEEAIRHYQRLVVDYPRGRFFYHSKENLAEIYAEDTDSLHRALQLYQQLLLAERLKDRHDTFRYRLGRLNMELGKMDQARLEFRNLLTSHPDSPYRSEVYYLTAYTYYLEKRMDLALLVFSQTAKTFPNQPISVRARYFVADTLEEQGRMKEALKAFTALKAEHPNPAVVEKRIVSLKGRMRRSVR